MLTLLGDHIQLYEFITLWALYIIIPLFIILAVFIGTAAIVFPITWLLGCI